MIDLQIASPIPMPPGLVVKKASKMWPLLLGSTPPPPSLHCHADACWVRGRANDELAQVPRDTLHRLGAVGQEIHEHLLQLDAVAGYCR